MKTTIPDLLTERDGLLYVRTHDQHHIHQSFETEEGKVIVFESMLIITHRMLYVCSKI